MNSIFLEFLDLVLIRIQSIKSSLVLDLVYDVCILLTSVHKQAVLQILMQISVQAANPHAHFYSIVNKDNNQMNKIL